MFRLRKSTNVKGNYKRIEHLPISHNLTKNEPDIRLNVLYIMYEQFDLFWFLMNA
jgi:hypothetical protein